jgi:hypothetical protein
MVERIVEAVAAGNAWGVRVGAIWGGLGASVASVASVASIVASEGGEGASGGLGAWGLGGLVREWGDDAS